MFGNKKKKEERLEKLTQIVKDGNWHSQSELADKVGVARSTIFKDLPHLDARGVHLEEDERQRIRHSRWWRR